MVACSRLPLRLWRNGVGILLLVNLVLVGLTYIEPFKVEINGAHRWIEIPGLEWLRFQPSELLKLTTILYFAAWMTPRQGAMHRAASSNQHAAWWWIGCLLWFVGCILVVEQPDLGTTMLIFMIALGTAFLAGLPLTRMALLLVILGLVAVGWVYQEPYRIERFKTFLAPWKEYERTGYQMVRAQLAVRNGHLWGAGLGQGREKRFLPAAKTDYIFATVAEETGLVGSSLYLLVLSGMIGRCFWIASRSPVQYSKVVVGGIGVWIAGQSLVNLAMAIGLVPPIGVPLPFVSYGGSSLVVLMSALGIVHRVSSVPRRLESS